ncbi:DoxX family protein [Actinoplanes sp. NPDC049118]|uniref:DoxX family protein n=1 Tax=Actinoplanes sp. NPDC049118 TaxID=3155769 RepID=UPI0033CC3FBA
MFVVLSLLLVAVCLVPAAAKLAGHPKMRHAATHFGIAWRRYQLIGVAELVATVGVLVGFFWRPAGLLAAVGMTLLLLGALITHLRAHDHVREALPALLALAVSGTYLAVAQ